MDEREPLAWGKSVTADFRERVFLLCDRFHWSASQPSDLMACIAFESGETFSPWVLNGAGSGAIGLIQFMPQTALTLGTSAAQLARMSAVEQLDWVERYFEPYHARIRSLPDMYMAILLPKYVGKPDDSVLFSGGIAYRQNSGLDDNHDGRITKGEAAERVLEKRAKGLSNEHVFP